MIQRVLDPNALASRCGRVWGPQRGRWPGLAVCLLVLLVGANYFTRLTTLSIRGEESRWARVAVEMLESGDWIVPRQQAQPFLSRPPLQSWTIALVSLVTGDVSPTAIRLPSVLAVLSTTLLVYGYSRSFLSPLGALAAGASFASMAQVLELGRRGETDALFTLFVSGSLLLWHIGYMRRWPAWRTWAVGYLFAALGGLTKGLQAPLYFVGSTTAFLILQREPRFWVSWSHAGGILGFLAVVAAWQVPFSLDLGWGGTQEIWFGDILTVFSGTRAAVMSHLVTYPFEVMACMLPWSGLLICFLVRDFRKSVGGARPYMFFLVTCLLVTFPTVWLPPGARGRYFMPLYPCVAPLVGLIVERSFQGASGSGGGGVWAWYLRGLAGIMAVAGLTVLGASLLLTPRDFAWAQPLVFAAVYASVAMAGALALVWISSKPADPVRGAAGMLAVAGFVGLSFTGVMINKLVNISPDTEAAIARLKEQLPKGQPLASFGPVHHLFAYYYRAPIRLVAWPGDAAALRGRTAYFCFNRFPGMEVALPFAWQEVASIPVGRFRDHPFPIVVVGRRIPSGEGIAKSRESP